MKLSALEKTVKIQTLPFLPVASQAAQCLRGTCFNSLTTAPPVVNIIGSSANVNLAFQVTLGAARAMGLSEPLTEWQSLIFWTLFWVLGLFICYLVWTCHHINIRLTGSGCNVMFIVLNELQIKHIGVSPVHYCFKWIFVGNCWSYSATICGTV